MNKDGQERKNKLSEGKGVRTNANLSAKNVESHVTRVEGMWRGWFI